MLGTWLEQDSEALESSPYRMTDSPAMVQTVKNLPACRRLRLDPYLGREDPPEKRMATPSSILAWRIPWTEESGGPQSMGSQRDGYD